MNFTLAFLSLLILGSAAVAAGRRNLIHSALLFVTSWAGVALFYLWAGAEFMAFAQLLVYVGAIAMIALFAVLLTRQSPAGAAGEPRAPGRVIAAVITGAAVFGVLAAAILHTDLNTAAVKAAPGLTVRELGTQLMTMNPAAILVIGVMLTVSLLGAIVLAASDPKEKGDVP